MSDPHAIPPSPGLREIAVAIAMTAWVVAVARTEPSTPLTPPIVSYATAAR